MGGSLIHVITGRPSGDKITRIPWWAVHNVYLEKLAVGMFVFNII